jgi:hypothetical protein
VTAVIFEVWPRLVMTRQGVLAGTEAVADLGALLVWRWPEQRRVGVSTGWRDNGRGRVGKPRSVGFSPTS